MSFREDPRTIGERIADIERRLRAVEQPGVLPPDPGWVLTEIDNGLYYLFVPSGATGPKIGQK